ncbi:MAG TPA: GNAT family N-acetyltransferase [Pseudonocardiaceae bacterium]|jgi:aminoglycoside 2'-N-acetyltransferase I
MAPVAELRIAHTADLDAATLRTIRTLLDEVFAGEFTDLDWDHAVGGMHALAWDGAELIGHASLIQRRLLHAGRALRAGYVEGLGVRPTRRGRRHGAALMAALERVVRGAYHLGALSTTEQAAGFYAGRGWLAWQGPCYALTPTGIIRTPDDDDGIYVLPCGVPLELNRGLTCDWRDGDVW